MKIVNHFFLNQKYLGSTYFLAFFKCKQMVEFNKKLINDLFIVKCWNASEGKNCARAKNKLIEKRQLSNTKRTVHPTLFLEFIKKSVEVIRILQKEQNKSK